MTQFEVLDILKANPNKEFTNRELGKLLNMQEQTVSINCKKLLKCKCVTMEKRILKSSNVNFYKYNGLKNEQTNKL